LVLLTKYYAGNGIKEGEVDGSCSMHGRDNKVCRVLVKQQGNRPLRKPKCRWEDEIMDLK
jgi:hypothetical protein